MIVIYSSVCTHIVHLKKKKLHYYTGNYDSFVQTRAEMEEEQMKRYKWEQDQIKQMKVLTVQAFFISDVDRNTSRDSDMELPKMPSRLRARKRLWKKWFAEV